MYMYIIIIITNLYISFWLLLFILEGIRYLDIRVGYYPSYPEKLWVNHNFYRMRPLSEIVKDVARFVEETNEIVSYLRNW